MEGITQALHLVCSSYRWGYVDRKGSVVIKPSFPSACDFVDGLACVNTGGTVEDEESVVGGKWGFIDPGGDFAIPPQFDLATSFCDGLAPVNIGAKVEYAFRDEFYYMRGGLWGYIDRTGEQVIPPSFTSASGFHGNLAVAQQDGKSGFINRTGTWVIPPLFQACEPFAEGLAVVWDGDKWGFINEAGEYAIEPRYGLAYDFDNGTAPVLVDETYSWHYIDKTGNIVASAPPEVTEIGSFEQNLATGSVDKRIRMKDGSIRASVRTHNTGYFDRSSQWVIPPQYDSAGDFVEDRAWVELKSNYYGYIRLDGSLLKLPKLNHAGNFRNGLAQVRIRNKFRLIDKEGSIVWGE